MIFVTQLLIAFQFVSPPENADSITLPPAMSEMCCVESDIWPVLTAQPFGAQRFKNSVCELIRFGTVLGSSTTGW